MGRNYLYTYSSLEEFNKYYSENDGDYFLPFIDECKDIVEEEKGYIFDITTFAERFVRERELVNFAMHSFKNLDEDNKVIIREDLADLVLYLLPLVFSEKLKIYDSTEENEEAATRIKEKFNQERKVLYKYDSVSFLALMKHIEEHNIEITNFSNLSSINSELSEYDRITKNYLIDITSLVKTCKTQNPQIIYYAESIINILENAHFIISDTEEDDALNIFKLSFYKVDKINNILDLEISSGGKSEDDSGKFEDKLIKLTNVEHENLNKLFVDLNKNLIGHDNFKINFESTVRSFIKLNRIKEKSVLSLFLLGSSGIGKTEVGKILKNSLNPNTNLVKINFGNYSSQDALNSLIGSPAGYVGYEDGELAKKIKKSKLGVIICDEFEKTTKPVFNFFLELLEDGSFTDSTGHEFDLNGYIVIFTSNLLNAEEFYNTVPPELQSRMDLVCEFKNLSNIDKKQFLYKQVEDFVDSYSVLESLDIGKEKITTELKLRVNEIDYISINNLRDLKRIVQKKITNYLDESGLI